MKICAEVCSYKNTACAEEECRMWIDYEEDLNCTEIAIEKKWSHDFKGSGKKT